MNTDDRDRLRKISFREFADEWLDRLNPKYDPIGDLWITTFRSEIVSYLNAIRNKVDSLIGLITATEAEEAYEAFAAEFGRDELPKLPAYESILPVIRELGGRDDDSALTVIGIFEYARARRLSGVEGDNLGSNPPHP
jgi:hypothetical protein